MEAMTIREAGAEGVFTAISDGMKAAGYARQLKAAHEANELLTAEIDALKNELAAKEAENKRLNNENRKHRFSKSRAYSNAIEMQVAGVDSRSFKILKGAMLVMLGTILGLVIAFIILRAFGV